MGDIIYAQPHRDRYLIIQKLTVVPKKNQKNSAMKNCTKTQTQLPYTEGGERDYRQNWSIEKPLIAKIHSFEDIPIFRSIY